MTDPRARVLSEANTIRDFFDSEATQIRDLGDERKYSFHPPGLKFVVIGGQKGHTTLIRLSAGRVDLGQYL